MAKRQGTGDCYEANAKYLMDIFMSDRHTDIMLCHGLAVGQGPIQGVKHGHAWLEVNNNVLDFSNGRSIVMDKDKYYEIGQIKYVHRYTAREAARKLVETGHYGPWE